jgi:hypothetical protein
MLMTVLADALAVSFKWMKGEMIGKGSYGKVRRAAHV